MKIFYKEIDLENREEMIRFLNEHFRYNTANGWNHSTSYANNLKLYNLGLDKETEDKLWDLMDCEGAYDLINDRLADFAYEHDHRWQAGFNGRSGGYLVLYQGGWKCSDFKSYCTSCGQRNFTKVEETGCKCGRCGKGNRINYSYPLKDFFTYPGKSVDMYEDFKGWSMEELRERVKLIQEFDQLCDDIVSEAIYISENYEVVEEEYFVPSIRRILKEAAS